MSAPVVDPEAAEHVEAALQYRFVDRSRLVTALTHRSYLAEHPELASYERLEFLGDAVLQLGVTDLLYETTSGAAEGEMAKIRAAVVSETTLAAVAREWGLDAVLFLGRGEELTGGREKDSILSDAVEAILGVVYLEAGFERAAALVRHHWGPLIAERATAPGQRDYKTRLQEVLAQEGMQPSYALSEEGPQHAKEFTAVVRAADRVLGSGTGTSKKRAEQAAARDAMKEHAAESGERDA